MLSSVLRVHSKFPVEIVVVLFGILTYFLDRTSHLCIFDRSHISLISYSKTENVYVWKSNFERVGS